MIFRAVDDKAEFWLDGAAGENLDVTGCSRITIARRLQETGNRTLSDRSIDDNAKCTRLVVPDDENDGMGKPRIADRRSRDQ